ncbi:MAG: MaoC family dehydratase [Dehalococcoidales bacterium]|nr:MaoC family dehydratase [Dehalococcoidales bacterium]
MTVPINKIEPGYKLPHLQKQIKIENIKLFSACTGKSFHTDPEIAKGMGLPNVIAQGLMGHIYIIEMLVRAFGRDFLETGKVSAKFIELVFPGDCLFVRGEVASKNQESNGLSVALNVWCERMWGQKTTVGTATVLIRNAS